jgi:uncharacterized protein with HEPN domain
VKYCDQIEAFLLGFTREAFDADLRTQNAVLYSLQTVGEAAIRLDKRYPHVPWRDVRGLSNIVRHGYDDNASFGRTSALESLAEVE